MEKALKAWNGHIYNTENIKYWDRNVRFICLYVILYRQAKVRSTRILSFLLPLVVLTLLLLKPLFVNCLIVLSYILTENEKINKFNYSCMNCTCISIYLSFFLSLYFCRFCVVIRFFHPHHNGMTSDFAGFSIPDFIHYNYYPILILQKSQYFPF